MLGKKPSVGASQVGNRCAMKSVNDIDDPYLMTADDTDADLDLSDEELDDDDDDDEADIEESDAMRSSQPDR